MYDLIIRDATIIRSTGREVADIGIEDGRIAYVGARAPGGAREEISGIGRFVIPGLVDTQVRLRDPRDPARQDWAGGTRAAVAHGVTTVVDLPDPDRPRLAADALRALLDAARREAVASVALWCSIGPEHVDAARALVAEGLAAAPHVRMDAADGPLAFDEAALDALAAAWEGPVGVLAASADDPASAEGAAAAVARLVELARRRDHPFHVTGLSTAAELNVLDPHRPEVPVTCAVTPLHLFLSRETVAEEWAHIRAEPPVRGELDRRALWTAIKRGRIDAFASGHVARPRPAAPDPGPPGAPGVETLFGLLVGAVKNGRLNLERFVGMACERPARLLGLEGKGRIEEGADADLVVFREGVTGRLRRAPAGAAVDWTPFVGREVGVPPDLVIVGGRIVARAGRVDPNAPPAAPARLSGRG